MSFYEEKMIKSVRKARACEGCCVKIEVGESALQCAGAGDDGFWSATYHHECRKAEEGLNDLHDFRNGDEWMSLGDMDWEDWPWLIEAFPTVAARMKITTERFNEVRDQRERTDKYWREVAAKRYEAQRAGRNWR